MIYQTGLHTETIRCRILFVGICWQSDCIATDYTNTCRLVTGWRRWRASVLCRMVCGHACCRSLLIYNRCICFCVNVCFQSCPCECCAGISILTCVSSQPCVCIFNNVHESPQTKDLSLVFVRVHYPALSRECSAWRSSWWKLPGAS